jgi:hypothetical protein
MKKTQKTNLFLYPQDHKAEVDWDKFSVVTGAWQGKVDECNILTVPPASRPPPGLISRFVQLRNFEERAFKGRLTSFVALYGKLGVTGYPEFSYDPPPYGIADEEDISWWVEYAEDINRLLRLYRAIKRARSARASDVPDILNKVVTFEQANTSRREKKTRFVNSFWAETGEQTGFMKELNITEMTSSDMIEGACSILVGSISRGLAGGISLGMGGFRPSKKFPIGYAIIEERYTYSPLAAVYNELWETVRADEPVEVCAYGKCSKLFTPQRSTGKFCSGTCRTAHNRELKKVPE